VLFLVLVEKSPLVEILTTHTVASPRHRVESLVRHGFAAVNTLGVLATFYSLKSLINEIQ
jgi:hypothetical protein